MSSFREMRMIVIFDLPTKTDNDKREYRRFRKNLLKEGFIMIQFSVYSRFCRNDTEYAKYVRKIKKVAPKTKGEIRIIGLTEKQYEKMHLISSKRKTDEELLGISPLIVIE